MSPTNLRKPIIATYPERFITLDSSKCRFYLQADAAGLSRLDFLTGVMDLFDRVFGDLRYDVKPINDFFEDAAFLRFKFAVPLHLYDDVWSRLTSTQLYLPSGRLLQPGCFSKTVQRHFRVVNFPEMSSVNDVVGFLHSAVPEVRVVTITHDLVHPLYSFDKAGTFLVLLEGPVDLLTSLRHHGIAFSGGFRRRIGFHPYKPPPPQPPAQREYWRSNVQLPLPQRDDRLAQSAPPAGQQMGVSMARAAAPAGEAVGPDGHLPARPRPPAKIRSLVVVPSPAPAAPPVHAAPVHDASSPPPPARAAAPAPSPSSSAGYASASSVEPDRLPDIDDRWRFADDPTLPVVARLWSPDNPTVSWQRRRRRQLRHERAHSVSLAFG